MLSVVPSPPLDEARVLLRFVEQFRPGPWVALEVLLLPLLGVGFLLAGVAPGAFLIGSAVALTLCRYGPHRWPGRR